MLQNSYHLEWHMQDEVAGRHAVAVRSRIAAGSRAAARRAEQRSPGRQRVILRLGRLILAWSGPAGGRAAAQTGAGAHPEGL